MSPEDQLLRQLDKAGGQGLEIDRLNYPAGTIAELVKRGHARIDFGRAYAVRRLRPARETDLS